MSDALPIIAITTGEPAGVGPEISIQGAWELKKTIHPILIGDYQRLKQIAQKIDKSIKLQSLDPHQITRKNLQTAPDVIGVIHSSLGASVIPGLLNPKNSHAVLAYLDAAIEGTLNGYFDAVVTAPVQKSIINDAGIPFTGHTEYFAEKTHTNQVVMMLAGQTKLFDDTHSVYSLRVALATTHLALKDVISGITIDSLLEILSILHNDFQEKLGISSPRILLTGLNPHAGENGYLGNEEINIIIPAILRARQMGIQALGPFPADTLFQPRHLEKADCILAMYHDQGLPVLKYATFGKGVNITLGLPLIRTSVDHGTALDIASKGIGLADYGSMIEAIKVAANMASHWQQKHLYIN